MRTAVDRLYEEAAAVITVLEQTGELSLQVSAADHFRKALLLACASHFEHLLCASVLEFVRDCSGGSTLIQNFVKNKAVVRQYHSWFKWDDNNANHFFGLFGSDFRTKMVARVKQSEELQASIRFFLEIGSERNRLVHQDYVTFPLEKTIEEIYASYKAGLKFVQDMPKAFQEYHQSVDCN